LLPASHPKSSKKEASTLTAGVYEVNENTYSPQGAEFYIPLVIPEGIESGDGRVFEKGAIDIRDLPLPLLWQIKTGTGHDGSAVVGRIDRMEQIEGGIGNAYGVFDSGPYGKEAERLVREGFLKGVSADMDKFEAREEEDGDDDKKSDSKFKSSEKKNKRIKKDKIVIDKARVMAVTIVSKPAFQECKIFLVEDEENRKMEEPVIQDGIYFEDGDPAETAALIACGIVASSIPTAPPKEWFGNPQLKEPTPLTVTDDGKVFGHIAAWHVDHIGMAFGTRPPRSRSKYAYFHTGVVRTEEGSDVPVGQLTLAGGHADITASANEAVKHYDDTASAVADVYAGEDSYGIWVAGALRPGTTPEQIRALRASAPSGDWRPIKGSLELVAVCQVNVPGFPVARARVASGQVMALVAAGASSLARLKANPVEELLSRVDRLEAKEKQALIATAAEAKTRFNSMRPAQDEPALEEIETILADGIYVEVSPQIVESLEYLLADVVALSFVAQGYHWNVKGENFPQYHELFGEIYEDISGSIDPFAENILKLGYDAPFTLSTLAEMSDIAASATAENSCNAMAYDLYITNEHVISKLKNAFAVADAANEQGIADFLGGRIDMHQKWSWQLKASSMPEKMAKPEYEDSDEPYQMVFSALSEEGLPEIEELSLTASAELSDSDRVLEFATLVEFAIFTAAQREALAKEGKALKDGSYPIRNKADLKNAIRAIGRANKAKRAAVKKHILKRAKALGATKLIPESWGLTASAEDMRARIEAFSAEVEKLKKAQTES
jgi:DNA-binding ferritin-like protein